MTIILDDRNSLGFILFRLKLMSLQWRHNARDGVSNHQPQDCLLNRLFRRRSKKTSKLRVAGLCEGNSPVTGEFPAQMASNAENVSIWWRHHGTKGTSSIDTVCFKMYLNSIDRCKCRKMLFSVSKMPFYMRWLLSGLSLLENVQTVSYQSMQSWNSS